MDYHSFLSAAVILLTFVGYVPYVRDIFLGKTKPHAFTWFAVALTAFIAYALQVEGGAGVGAWPMLVVSLICVLVFVLSLWRGTKDITRSDVVFLCLSLVALFLWLVVKQPILSILLITASEILSYVPTVRKSWKEPYSETLALYQVSMFRHGLAVFAVEQMNLLTALYPAAWALTNLTITVILTLRRRVVPKP